MSSMHTSTIIAIVNQKGGVGKTTTAVNIGAALARAGETVLLADLDPQANASSGLGVPEQDRQPGMYELLRKEVSAADILQPTHIEGYNILPSSPDLAGAAVELVQVPQREFRLRGGLDELKPHFRYILIDAPPSLGLLTMNALAAADCVLVPVQSEYYALEGLGQLLNTVMLVQKHVHSHLSVLGAVVTLFDKRLNIAKQVVDEVRQHFPGHVFETVIPRNIRLTEAPSYGQTIFEYDAQSSGASAYEGLASEVRERVVQLARKEVAV